MPSRWSGAPPSEYLEALALEDAPDPSPLAARPAAFSTRSDADVEHMPPVEWLADGVLPLGAIAALYGAPGSGKSFLAIDLALSLAIGTPWLGRPVAGGSTLYVAAEGWRGIGSRVRAWKAARGLEGRYLGVTFVNETVNLLDPAHVAKLAATAADVEQQSGKPLRLIVIDTLAQCMIGGDENEAQDMSRVMAAAQRLRERTGATAFFQHHTRKDSEIERGSSALRGAVDSLVLCVESDDGRQLVCQKQKDAEAFAPISFTLVAGHGSCVVASTGGDSPAGPTGPGARLTPQRVKALRSLADAFTDRGATTTEWLRATDLPERTYYHVRTWLCREGYVLEKGTRYTLTPSGKYALTATATATRLQSPLQSPSMAPLKGGHGVAAPELAAMQTANSNGKRPGAEDPYWSDLMSEVDERIGIQEEG